MTVLYVFFWFCRGSFGSFKGGYGHKNCTYSTIHVFIVFCDPENIGIDTILVVVSAIVFVLWRFL